MLHVNKRQFFTSPSVFPAEYLTNSHLHFPKHMEIVKLGKVQKQDNLYPL